MLFVKKVSFFLLFALSFSVEGVWVAKDGDWVLYENDFYSHFPKSDWLTVQEKEKKESLFFGFLKKQAAVKEALSLGLNHNFDVIKKISTREKMLLVNEYYMRHFLSSLIPPSSLVFCQNNLKREVFVKHILLQPEGVGPDALKDSLLLGVSFGSLAKRHSKDPSVSKNKGLLGWVSLGQTVPEFESAVFGLCLGCVGVVETSFGVHVVLVDSVRASKYVDMPLENYNDFAFRFATAYIKEDLKTLAANHDSLLIRSKKVSFNRRALQGLVDSVKKARSQQKKGLDVLGVLKGSPAVLVVYNGEFLGGAWFANKLSSSLKSTILFDSVEKLETELVTVLLRDIAFNRALELGLNKNFTFYSQFQAVRESVLEKAFLKYLIENVSFPTKQEVSDFFNSTDQGNRSLDVAYNSIEAILLKEKQKKAKEAFFDSVVSGGRFKINKDWLYD
tara:strand:- start:375 stop:1715 length:1341 start_codon:yes stop_codon:yes gene_type:complete